MKSKMEPANSSVNYQDIRQLYIINDKIHVIILQTSNETQMNKAGSSLAT